MLFGKRLMWSLGAVFLFLPLGGCSLSGESQHDDEKEPHFVLGKSRVNAMDYSGAAEAFDEALEVSPHSAAAHFQLGWLDENKLADPAGAIYHYEEYLKLDPKAGNREVIRERIFACKQQLVADVMPLPSAPAAQRQLEFLAETNRVMHDELDKWHAYYAAQIAAGPGTAAGAAGAGLPAAVPVPAHPARPGGVTPSVLAPPARTRTHLVAAGETLAAIARKTGVSVAELQAANPGLNPRRLRAGQTINLPLP